MLINGKTKSGFKYQIQKEQVENYEFIELIGEVEENPVIFPRVINMLLGKEQVATLKDHVRTEDGYVPAEAMIAEFQEIMKNPKLKK